MLALKKTAVFLLLSTQVAAQAVVCAATDGSKPQFVRRGDVAILTNYTSNDIRDDRSLDCERRSQWSDPKECHNWFGYPDEVHGVTVVEINVEQDRLTEAGVIFDQDRLLTTFIKEFPMACKDG